MDLMELSYSPEVASSLLQIQQAAAKVDARKLIVEGAVNIVSDAMQGLDDHMERPGLVTEKTYGGGGNTITGRRFRSGANDDDKKDK